MSAAPEEGRPRRVFISGALGFMGRALSDRYQSMGVEVRGVDRVGDQARNVVAGDTSTLGGWRDHVRGCDLVIHTAALVSFSGDDGEFWRVNVLGTRRVLDAAVDGGAKRFIHISSVTAFSFDFPDGVDEHYPTRVNGSPYVDTKVTGEQVVLQAHAAGEIECTVIRPGDVYGPGSRPWVIIPVEMMQKGQFVLPGKGDGVFSPTYIENLVDAIVLAAANPRASGQVLTITDGIGVSNLDYFERLARVVGVDVRLAPAPVLRGVSRVLARASKAAGRHTEVNPFSVAYLGRTGTYSIKKAQTMLGYEPKVSLDEGMSLTEQWLRAEGRV